ncbi:WG repeat-containing protein [Pontibacillus salicampi]|uniref:WG repeat-containing protein n=1 Tax=Pontibacillus salicampi TaxID=1449801 RepID=A0ABV6LME9_9BACI
MHQKLYPAAMQTVTGEKWGYINVKGLFVIDPQFNQARDFQKNGLAIVEVDGLYGVLDTTGSFIVKPQYDYISSFSEERASASNSKGTWVINEEGTLLTSTPYPYIGRYENGMAVFNKDTESGVRYGYLDRQGQEALRPIYLSADDFQEKKALVKVRENDFALINRNGSVLYSYLYPYVGARGDGLLAFQRDSGGKYGYINEKGRIVVEPQFDGAQRFYEQRAIINRIDDYLYYYGVIDRKGNMVIEPEFNDIVPMKENRFAVGKAKKPSEPYLGSTYAIVKADGEYLSDFRYESVQPYEKGFASAHDRENTFFLNKKGKIAQHMPILPGQGAMVLEGSLIRATIDYQLFYVNREGKLIWRPNKTIRLNHQYRVLQWKYKPNPDYLVYYPVVRGMEDTKAQQRVNETLREISQVKPIPPEEQLDYSFYGDFEIEFFQQEILVLQLNGSKYYFGAAHPMPTRTYTNIHLTDGTFFELKDLFKENSDYVKVLSELVGKDIQHDEQYDYIFPGSYKGVAPNQPFYVNERELFLYYPPYDIAPYAAGFVTFSIPFTEINDIINHQGAFWKSFHE